MTADLRDRLVFRRATRADVPTIVAMLADDFLGRTRERPDDLGPYLAAFERIDAAPEQELMVVELDGAAVGTFQLTYIPYLTHTAALRAVIEAVRVASDRRGTGLGHAIFAWVTAHVRERGCDVLQLSTDKRRVDAHRFYEDLGFVASHEGMKLSLGAH